MTIILLKFKDRLISETNLGQTGLTIGRDRGSDIQIDNPAVSGTHATIWQEGENIIIKDADSTNGTYFKGQRVSRKTLVNNDEVVIGKHTIQVIHKDGVDENDAYPQTTTIVPSLDKTVIMEKKVKEKVIGSTKKDTGIFVRLDGGIVDKDRYELNEKVTTIGKSTNALIRLKGIFTPKVVALVNRTDKGYIITLTTRRRLLKINGSHIKKQYHLKDKDIVMIRELKLQFLESVK